MTLREIFAPTFGPIAQLARASVWHTEGREFESRWVHNVQNRRFLRCRNVEIIKISYVPQKNLEACESG